MSGTNLNRIKNKRMQKNNTSGVTGVSFHSGMGQWYARISLKGKRIAWVILMSLMMRLKPGEMRKRSCMMVSYLK